MTSEPPDRRPRRPLQVPDVVRNKARAAGADRWLAELPDLADALAEEWSITLGRPFPDATEAWVADATTADGRAAVLKIAIPRDADTIAREIAVLEHVAGDGCVELFRSDVARGAMLTARLGPSMHRLGLPSARRLELLCDTAARVWRPAPGLALPTCADKGRWLIEFIATTWERLDRPCAERSVDHAFACARRRIAAHDDDRAVLVHGDVHEWNALQDGDGFTLIDPDGLHGAAEYDLGILMREDPVELRSGDPHDRSRLLARRTGLDEVAIWEWGVVERVSTGLLATEVGLQPVGREMLETADLLSRSA